MFMKQYLLLILLSLSVFNCNPGETLTPPRPPRVVEGTVMCKDAEIHLTELKCEIAKPTKKGKSFEQFCKETQDAGIFINPKCLTTVNNCEEAVDICTGSR